MAASSYLEEYRRKFGFIGETTPATKLEKRHNIDDLLNRYLRTQTPTTPDKEKLTPVVTLLEKPIEQLEKPVELSPESEDDGFNSPTQSDGETFDTFADEQFLLDESSTVIEVDVVMRNDRRAVERRKKSRRRYSSPYGSRNTNSTDPELSKSTLTKTLSLRRYSTEIPGDRDNNQENVFLRRNASSVSSISLESNGSSWSQSELSIISDTEDKTTIIEQDLARFQLDSESQKDAESVTSYKEPDSPCPDCEHKKTGDFNVRKPTPYTTELCAKCSKHQVERFEIIQEILNSEVSYGADLKVIQEQFYETLCNTGLITPEQLTAVFGNLTELIAVNRKFIDLFKDHLEQLQKSGDETYRTACIGQLMCEMSTMLLAFENYCLNYTDAVSLIEQLRKEKELLNLFLDVSQNENQHLRRMGLKAFLMLPVQRVMKYPLLLKRLHKVMPVHHSDRDAIALAVEKLNSILTHINSQSKLISNMLTGNRDTAASKKRTSFDIALVKLAMGAVGWRHDEIHFVVSGKIGFLLSTDSQTADKLKLLRFNNAHSVIISKGKDLQIGHQKSCNHITFCPKSTNVTQANLLLIKKGKSRLALLQDPIPLNRCIISRSDGFHDIFDIQVNIRESVTIRPVANCDTWYNSMKHFSMVLGGRNQRRRNALSNIVLHN